MAVSKSYTSNPANVKAVLEAYCGLDKPTMFEVGHRLGATFQNVRYIINEHLPPERAKAEKALRYSRSKMGMQNPMLRKSGTLHHNYKGVISDGNGYLMKKVGRKYTLVHRLTFKEALERLTLAFFEVHHIDGDKLNNDLDNLALVTPAGHRQLHAKRSRFERSPLWAQWVSGALK